MDLEKKIQKHIDAISARRDKLRQLLYDVEEVCTDCDEAIEALASAVDVLSRNV